VFYLSTIRDGHGWGDDFSMYIQHAKNIAEGADYERSGYIYNPRYPSLGPKAYPPIFPLLLAPIYSAFGLNLNVMKIEVVGFFVLFLAIFFLAFKDELPFHYIGATIAIVGFNYYFWEFKDNVLSDIPFTLFAFLSLLLIQRADGPRFSVSQGLSAVMTGFFIYLSYGTRAFGVVLIPCLLIYEVMRFKRPTRFGIIATIISGILMLAQSIFVHGLGSYFDQLAINPRTLLLNLLWYGVTYDDIWYNGYSGTLHHLLSLLILGLAIIGYLSRLRDITVFEIFVPLYLLVVIVWPSFQGTRFLIPVIPLIVLYALAAIAKITERLIRVRLTVISRLTAESSIELIGSVRQRPSQIHGRIRRTYIFKRKDIEMLAFGGLFLAISLSYIGAYTKRDFGFVREGIGKKETVELFDYIRQNTTKNDIIIFQKPRALSLYTERSASALHLPVNDQDWWNYFRDIGATYIIDAKPLDSTQEAYMLDSTLEAFIQKYRDDFELVYSNPDFKVYRIHLAAGSFQH